MRKVGAYLPGAHEEVIDIVTAFILTDKVTPPLGSDWMIPGLAQEFGLDVPLSCPSESAPRSRSEGLQGRRRARAPHWGRVAGDGGCQGGAHPVSGGGGGGRGPGDHPDQQTVLRDPGPGRSRRETSAGKEAGGEGLHLLSSSRMSELLLLLSTFFLSSLRVSAPFSCSQGSFWRTASRTSTSSPRRRGWFCARWRPSRTPKR